MGYQILNADAAEIVPLLGPFDYVITDPPYSIGGSSSMKSNASVAGAQAMINYALRSLIFRVIADVTKSDAFAAWMFCSWREISYFATAFERIGLMSQSGLVWDKQSAGFSERYAPAYEMILYASRRGQDGKRLARGAAGPDLMDVPKVPAQEKNHPFEKPPELVERFAAAFPPGRVLDPFCGTGGLLLGAQRLGWDVVGIDIDPDACEIAEQRLQSAL